MKGKLAIENLLFILPNKLEIIIELENDMKKIIDELKIMDNQSNHIDYLWKIAQYQLLCRFVRVIISKVEQTPRGDLEEKEILRNEEWEYDEYRKKYANCELGNRGVKKELVKKAKRFIEGKRLNSEKLFKIFGL